MFGSYLELPIVAIRQPPKQRTSPPHDLCFAANLSCLRNWCPSLCWSLKKTALRFEGHSFSYEGDGYAKFDGLGVFNYPREALTETNPLVWNTREYTFVS